MATVSKTIENRIVRIGVGSIIELDSGRSDRLLPSDWEACMFRFPNPISGWETKHAIACNVEITGRTFAYRSQSYWVRVRIEWVIDGEPSTFSGAWLAVNPWSCESVA